MQSLFQHSDQNSETYQEWLVLLANCNKIFTFQLVLEWGPWKIDIHNETFCDFWYSFGTKSYEKEGSQKD